MNRSQLKTYAPQARRDFIEAVTVRAGQYGLTPAGAAPVTQRGDVAIIAGRNFTKAIAAKRKALEDRIRGKAADWAQGFAQTMEAIAYTWFNRLVAIRYMELHSYLDHGYRVLSARISTTENTEGTEKKGNSFASSSVKSVSSVVRLPEILQHAEHVDLPGLNRETVIDLKLAGDKEAELYRLLLVAQCNALSQAMPFLFEKLDDETELLLPDNLLHSDSLIRKLVHEIDEADWQEVEIIGWLYQFYISERKDEVIGKVVASEDIPAATQLFTPNWIVKYLVQNTLGRQWLATYPQSPLRGQMEYYIEPAEQTPEVLEQLKAITPAALNPEELTLLDPACGSGHILVEAYDLFQAIYQERGYRAKDIPALILQKNLFGLEIDDRAAQLASFALMMKARADDRRIFDGQVQPNILAFVETAGTWNAAEITHALNSPVNKEEAPPSEYLFKEIEDAQTPLFSKQAVGEKGHVSQADIASLLTLFENAKTFGSLIQVPPNLAAKLPEIQQRLDDVLKQGDLTHASALVIKPLVKQSRLLARHYDAVVANPPYMDKGMSSFVKKFAGRMYPEAKGNLFSMFMVRSLELAAVNGEAGLVTMQSWMFLSSFATLRESLFASTTLQTMAHLGPRAFPEISGEVVQTTAFVIRKSLLPAFRATFFRLIHGDDQDKRRRLSDRECVYSDVTQSDFAALPDSPVAYWIDSQVRSAFASNPPVSAIGQTRKGMVTADNERHVRYWFEVPYHSIGIGCANREEALATTRRWFPYNKGGQFRRWYGNIEHVVNWKDDGHDLRTIRHPTEDRVLATNFNLDFIFKPCITWSDLGSKAIAFRLVPTGCLFDASGLSVFVHDERRRLTLLSVLNSHFVQDVADVLNPTMHFQAGDCGKIPFAVACDDQQLDALSATAVGLAKTDWDQHETSWGFLEQPLIACRNDHSNLAQLYVCYSEQCKQAIGAMRQIEVDREAKVNRVYGFADNTYAINGSDLISLWHPDFTEDIKRLLSYAIGCMMGRYSLDKPALVYAHSGNQDFDPSQYQTFRADNDGIVPLLEMDWGIREDAANRIAEFVGVAWPKEHLEENLKFIADSLGPAAGEQPRQTIRRYLASPGAGGFFKHHLQMYKRRPIYWLFTSGKQRAFQCLVYLHRYHEGTLARMRTEHLIPLQGKVSARIDQLAAELTTATSAAHRKKLDKERETLRKQQTELQGFDEKLRHYADQRLSLDLDDGVKVNYAKFGDLLAEVKAVTGGKDEE